MDDEDLKALKNLAAFNFIPKALVVGTLSNLINFVILSRPCIKSSTNIFLSILAFADTFFMLLIYVFSKQYHDDVHHHTFEIYWRMFGLSHWFYTAFLYITVYLTLSLALDRYAAVNKPSRTQCRTTRAKNVASMILFACFLCSVSAAFEFQLVSEECKSDELCNRSQVVENVTMKRSLLEDNQMTLKSVEHDDRSYNFNEDKAITSHQRLVRSLDNDAFPIDVNLANYSFDFSTLNHKISNPTDDHYVNDFERNNATSGISPQRNHNTSLTNFYFFPVESTMAKNKFYRIVIKSVATIFLVLPEGGVALMLCLLTASAYRACKVRQILVHTPAINANTAKTQTDILNRENKITWLVTTLLVLFLICHTPNVVCTVYKAWLSIRGTSSDTKTTKNLILAFEIFCQLLMSINCCTKIFVYLLLYDEYWESLKNMKSCCQYSAAPTEQIINTSKHLFPSTKADIESLLNYSLNKKSYSTQIPPEARHQYLISTPRAHKTSFASNISITPRLSLAPSDAVGIELSLLRVNQISPIPLVEQNSCMQSNRSFKALELSPSPSAASLTRSKSLNIQSTVKHLPNCRLNKKFRN